MASSDTDQLYDFLLKAAKALLEKNGEMYPIAALIKVDNNEVRAVATHFGDDHPESITVIEELSQVLKTCASSKTSTTVGIAYDIRFQDEKEGQKRDAIRTELEHADGDSMTVTTPYIKNSTGGITFLTAFAEPKDHQWFKTV